MPVLVEAFSVLVRVESIQTKVGGGWDAFRRLIPNQTFCTDDELARVGFMVEEDAARFVDSLLEVGLEYLEGGTSDDLLAADQFRGAWAPCTWAEFARINLNPGGEPQMAAFARLIGGTAQQFATPQGWQFERSLSQTGETGNEGLRYLGHRDGNDVYFDPKLGDEVYVGRTTHPSPDAPNKACVGVPLVAPAKARPTAKRRRKA